MKKHFKKLEIFIDKSIPYLVVVLLFLIITPFVAEDFYHQYEKLFHTLDYIIIGIFVIDLIFKYIRVKHLKPFIKKYWLDILAVFPFYLLFRVVEESVLIFRATETLTESQPILHVISGVEEIGAKSAREVEALSKVKRVRFAAKFARPIARAPRILKAVAYYEEPKHQTKEFHKVMKRLK